MSKANSPGCSCCSCGSCTSLRTLDGFTLPKIYLDGWTIKTNWNLTTPFPGNPEPPENFCPTIVLEASNSAALSARVCVLEPDVVMTNSITESKSFSVYRAQNGFRPSMYQAQQSCESGNPVVGFWCGDVTLDHCCPGGPTISSSYFGTYTYTEKYKRFYTKTPIDITVQISLNCKKCVVDGKETSERVWIISSTARHRVQAGYTPRIEVSASEGESGGVGRQPGSTVPCTRSYEGYCDYAAASLGCSTEPYIGMDCAQGNAIISFTRQRIFPYDKDAPNKGFPQGICLNFTAEEAEYLPTNCMLSCCNFLQEPDEEPYSISVSGLTNPCWCNGTTSVTSTQFAVKGLNPCYHASGTVNNIPTYYCQCCNLGGGPDINGQGFPISCPSVGPEFCWETYRTELKWSGTPACNGNCLGSTSEPDENGLLIYGRSLCFTPILLTGRRCQCATGFSIYPTLTKTGGNMNTIQDLNRYVFGCTIWNPPPPNGVCKDCLVPGPVPLKELMSYSCSKDGLYCPNKNIGSFNLWGGPYRSDTGLSASISCSGFSAPANIEAGPTDWSICVRKAYRIVCELTEFNVNGPDTNLILLPAP